MRFKEYEVLPLRDEGEQAFLATSDREADYFSLFGLVEGEENEFYVCIGDYPNRAAAELTKSFLDNKKQRLPQQ